MSFWTPEAGILWEMREEKEKEKENWKMRAKDKCLALSKAFQIRWRKGVNLDLLYLYSLIWATRIQTVALWICGFLSELLGPPLCTRIEKIILLHEEPHWPVLDQLEGAIMRIVRLLCFSEILWRVYLRTYADWYHSTSHWCASWSLVSYYLGFLLSRGLSVGDNEKWTLQRSISQMKNPTLFSAMNLRSVC